MEEGEVVWGWDDHPEIVALVEVDASRHREWFEDYLEDRAEVFPEVEYYLEYGSWRSKEELTPEEEEKIEKSVYNRVKNECYYNAQTALLPDLTYVEGYAVGRTAIPHAWIEINEKVVEITPTVNYDKFDYYGTEFENVDVVDIMVKREQADPIVEAFV